MISAAAAILRTLDALGARQIFGIPGVHNLALYRALRSNERTRHVTARHECGAGFMADGCSRAGVGVGVAFVISGPGLTNVITAMGEAFHDSIPLIVVSTLPPRSMLDRGRTGCLHELRDSGAVARSVAKTSVRIERADDIAHAIAAAFSVATSGRPGPAHIEVPLDLLDKLVPAEIVQSAASAGRAAIDAAQARSRCAAESDVDAAVAALAAAQCPALIVGGGAVAAAAPLRRLAERLGAVTLETAAGKGVVGDAHALGLGARLHFPSVRRFVEEDADVVLAVGTELSPADTWRDTFVPRGRLVQINIDAAQLGRGGGCSGSGSGSTLRSVAIEADASAATEIILGHPALRAVPDGARAAGEARAAALRSGARAEASRVMASLGVPAEQHEPQIALLRALSAALGDDGTLVADMTVPAYLALSEFPCVAPRRFLHPVGYGTLGYALPAAIGHCVGGGGAPVAVLVGDGGFQFTMAELAVAVELELPLPIVVWNDEGYGAIRHAMRSEDTAVAAAEAAAEEGGAGDGSTRDASAASPLVGVDHAPLDFRLLAEAYGARFAAPDDEAELRQSIEEALAVERGARPTLIELRADTFARRRC